LIISQAAKLGLKILGLSANPDLQLMLEGTAIKPFVDKICRKLLNFDKYLSPSKKELISTNKEIKAPREPLKFTECEILEHAIITWINQKYNIDKGIWGKTCISCSKIAVSL
jgi:hypothetical protein